MLKDKYIIYPYWPAFILAVVGLMATCAITLSPGYTPRFSNSPTATITIPAFLLLVIWYSRYYILTETGITVMVLGVIPFRIPWDRVQQVLFFEKWDKGNKIEDMSNIVVILEGIEPYMYAQERVYHYLSRHPIRAFKIFVSKKNIEKTLSAFSRHCGTVHRFDH